MASAAKEPTVSAPAAWPVYQQAAADSWHLLAITFGLQSLAIICGAIGPSVAWASQLFAGNPNSPDYLFYWWSLWGSYVQTSAGTVFQGVQMSYAGAIIIYCGLGFSLIAWALALAAFVRVRRLAVAGAPPPAPGGCCGASFGCWASVAAIRGTLWAGWTLVVCGVIIGIVLRFIWNYPYWTATGLSGGPGLPLCIISLIAGAAGGGVLESAARRLRGLPGVGEGARCGSVASTADAGHVAATA
jgi:hypothetical protein